MVHRATARHWEFSRKRFGFGRPEADGRQGPPRVAMRPTAAVSEWKSLIPCHRRRIGQDPGHKRAGGGPVMAAGTRHSGAEPRDRLLLICKMRLRKDSVCIRSIH